MQPISCSSSPRSPARRASRSRSRPSASRLLAAHIEAESERRAVALDADISLVECRDVDELAALLQRADRTIDSGCPLLARTVSKSVPVRAVADRNPLKFLMVNTYPSNPARHGGGIRIQSLWGSMPADISAQAVVLAHTDGGPALMPLTRARAGFEQHVPFWPELRAAIAQLSAVTGTSSDDVALALAATGEDPFTGALRAAVGSGADALVLVHPFMVRQAIAAAPGMPIIYDSQNVEADLKASMFRDDEGGRKAVELVAQLEAEACAHASLVVCCTEDDRRRLIERYGVAADIVHVIPNGASIVSAVFTPWAARDLTAPRCVFAGSGHAPNLEAAAIVIEAAASLPEVGFDLVGDLASGLGHLALPPNVVLHGRVSDAEKQRLFAHAALALNPMKVGSGSNLKLVDYLAAGLPVLSSTVGARGFSPELVDCLELVAPEPARARRRDRHQPAARLVLDIGKGTRDRAKRIRLAGDQRPLRRTAPRHARRKRGRGGGGMTATRRTPSGGALAIHRAAAPRTRFASAVRAEGRRRAAGGKPPDRRRRGQQPVPRAVRPPALREHRLGALRAPGRTCRRSRRPRATTCRCATNPMTPCCARRCSSTSPTRTPCSPSSTGSCVPAGAST